MRRRDADRDVTRRALPGSGAPPNLRQSVTGEVMDDAQVILLRLMLPIFVMWFAATAIVALATVRLAGRSPTAALRLEPEAWLAVAATGAAVGGFLGISAALPAAQWTRLGPSLAMPLGLAAVGMVFGAALAAAVVAAFLWSRGGD